MMRSSSSKDGKSMPAGGFAVCRRSICRNSMAAICSSARISVPRRFEILVLRQGAAAREILVHHGDSAAHIAYLMRYGAHQDARAGHELMQVRFFARSQILGTIHHHRRQARTRAGAVRGEPDVRLKRLRQSACARGIAWRCGRKARPGQAPEHSLAPADNRESIFREARLAGSQTCDARHHWPAGRGLPSWW